MVTYWCCSFLILFLFQSLQLGETLDNGSFPVNQTFETEPAHDALTGDYVIDANLPKYEPPPVDLSGCLSQTKTNVSVNQNQYIHPDFNLTCPQIIEKYGYDLETIEVETEDGYILTIYRIKGSPKSPPRPGKVPALLWHGLLGNCMSWLFLYRDKSLAFQLADAGYDVYLGNARGNSYSQKHTRYKTDSEQYWDFSFHEIGYYDLPGTIDHILNITGQPDLYYIGHSLGTSFYMICMSERPEYGLKIRVGFLLCPAGLISDMTNLMTTSTLQLGTARYEIWKLEFGNYLDEFLVNADSRFKIANPFCSKEAKQCGACGNGLYYSTGYNAKQANGSIVFFFGTRYVDRSSTKLFCHVAQIFLNKEAKFMYKFDYQNVLVNLNKYGTVSAPPYQLDRIIAPTVVYWSLGDNLTPPNGVKKTVGLFAKGVIKENNRIPDKDFTHMDFITANDINKLVYNRILYIMNTKMYIEKAILKL